MTRLALSVADIYCGAGGLSAGFAAAGLDLSEGRGQYEIVYGLDRDRDAVRSFNAYHSKLSSDRRSDVGHCAAVSDVTAPSILEQAGVSAIDILIGGPNCQGVSSSGLRNPRDKRNEMFRRFVELVKELRPAWFVIENVPGLVHANNRELLRTILHELGAIPGYRTEADVLLAAHYGVPQLRYRVFFVGNRTGAPIRFPVPDILEPFGFKTVKDAIADLAQLPVGLDSPVANHIAVEIGEENTRRISSIKPGEDWRDMPIELLPERFFATRASDQKGTYGRLEWDWPAYTVTSSALNVTAGPFTHPSADRPITVREAARLQSFDDEHVFFGQVESLYRQVGNAVPPGLARAVAQGILLCHFKPCEAATWGREGRIALQLLEDVEAGRKAFPVLTPRFPGRTPKWDRKPVVRSAEDRSNAWQDKRVSWNRRPSCNYPDQLETLQVLAGQPGNYRAAKRAKVIADYFGGVPKRDIIRDAKVSEASASRWITGFQHDGLDGWRAYHTSPEKMVANDPDVLERIKQATVRVREASSMIRLAKNGNKRLHMNDYLVDLRRRFGRYSTRELIEEVEQKLGRGIGTVYVGDLLAICDVVYEWVEQGAEKKEN